MHHQRDMVWLGVGVCLVLAGIFLGVAQVADQASRSTAEYQRGFDDGVASASATANLTANQDARAAVEERAMWADNFCQLGAKHAEWQYADCVAKFAFALTTPTPLPTARVVP